MDVITRGIQSRKRGGRMNIDEVIEKVCKKCKYYNKSFGVCKGELLPVEEAVIRNAAGQGTCDDIKNYLKEGK